MTKIDIFSGFLGAGKTTLIKKLIEEAYKGQKVVLIENEFGEIGIDGGFLKDAGIEITEMNSGCICCSLVGDFATALQKVIDDYHPDRVLIEPSGVGKLSDVIAAVKNMHTEGAVLDSFVTVVDASKAKAYMKNFGEFYNNQIQHAGAIVLSRTDSISDEKLNAVLEMIRTLNTVATVITTPWSQITGEQLLAAFDAQNGLTGELAELAAQEAEKHAHEHHHHHHHHDGEDHEHEHDDDEHEHHHHHDDDDDDEHEHEHHHHYDENGVCSCGHHHDHDADEVFVSWGRETPKKFSREEISAILDALDSGEYGVVLRAKGIVAGKDGRWIAYDMVPGEKELRDSSADVTGRICVIGSELKEKKIAELFGV